MPFVLVTIGVILLVASIRNTQGQLFTLIGGDFTGTNNFIYWFVSILLIGAVGYIPKLKPFSVAFLTLVVMILFLTKGNPSGIGGGFFSKFTQALGSTQTANVSSSPTSLGVASQPTMSQLTGQSATTLFPQTSTTVPVSTNPNQATLSFPS